MIRARSVHLPLALLTGLAIAVAPAAAQQSCGPATLSDEVRLSLEPRPDNALIVDATVELARPAAVLVEYGREDQGWLRSATSPTALAHHLPLLRLRAETTYQVRAFALDDAGCPRRAAAASATTGQLAPALRQRLTRAVGEPSFPVMLMDNRLTQAIGETRIGHLVAVDGAGQVVWYYTIPTDIPLVKSARASIAVKERANGNLIYQVSHYGFEEITRDARSVRRLPTLGKLDGRSNHHDFWELPDGRLLFLGTEDRPGSRESAESVRADTLNVLDPATGDVSRVWGAFDALNLSLRPEHWREVEERAADWTHANTVSIGSRGNVLVSLRHLDQVVSLSADLKRVEWRLGGMDSDFSFPEPSDRFFGQHDTREVAPNRLLMFDNGNYRPEGEYSRGLELELDFATMTARRVWEYRHRPDFFAHRLGNAVRLPGGNTLLNFGYNRNGPAGYTMADFGFPGETSSEAVLAVEARPDGTPAWSYWVEWDIPQTTRYRAYPLASLAGETTVAPTVVADRAPQNP